MLPGNVPSDLDLESTSSAEASGRNAIPTDLHGEFQGAAGAYAVLGEVVPLLLVGSAHSGRTDADPAVQLSIAAVLFVAMMAIALHSWVWLERTRRRLKAVEERRRRAILEEDARRLTLKDLAPTT